MRYMALLLGLPCAIALACCSSQQPSAIEAFAQDYCAYYMPCCGGDAGAPDPGTCKSTVVSWQSFGFDSSLTSACLTAMKQASATTDFCTTLGSAMAPCAAIFAAVGSSGTVQPGGTCTSYTDCASVSGGVAVCVPLASSHNSTTGTCSQVRRGLAGDTPCEGEEYDGVSSGEGSGGDPNVTYECHDFDGVYCDFATSTCEPFLATGQPCDLNGDNCGPFASCQSAYVNLPDGGVASSACAADLEAGAACDPTATDVSQVLCDPRVTRCRASTSTCTPFLPSGSACTTDDECEGSCVAGRCATVFEAELCNTSSASFKPASRPFRLVGPSGH
jgi:hypothetical protein